MVTVAGTLQELAVGELALDRLDRPSLIAKLWLKSRRMVVIADKGIEPTQCDGSQGHDWNNDY